MIGDDAVSTYEPPADKRLPSGDCPRCGSPYIQTFELAWRSGTAGYSLTSVYGSSKLAAFFGSIAPQGEQQTELARATSPPAEPSSGGAYVIPILLLIVGCVALLLLPFSGQGDLIAVAPVLMPLTVVCLIGAAISYLLLRPLVSRRRESARAEYERRLGEWGNSWVCTRCGMMWVDGFRD